MLFLLKNILLFHNANRVNCVCKLLFWFLLIAYKEANYSSENFINPIFLINCKAYVYKSLCLVRVMCISYSRLTVPSLFAYISAAWYEPHTCIAWLCVRRSLLVLRNVQIGQMADGFKERSERERERGTLTAP